MPEILLEEKPVRRALDLYELARFIGEVRGISKRFMLEQG